MTSGTSSARILHFFLAIPNKVVVVIYRLWMIIDAVKRVVQVTIILGGLASGVITSFKCQASITIVFFKFQASAVIAVIIRVISHFWAKLSSLLDVDFIVSLLLDVIYVVKNISTIQ